MMESLGKSILRGHHRRGAPAPQVLDARSSLRASRAHARTPGPGLGW